MRFLLVFVFYINAVVGLTQNTELNHPELKDSARIEINKTAVKDTAHSPKKAALYSLIPGGGQIYNHLAMPKGKKKAMWKIPIIYAGLGATGYYAIKNHQIQKTLKEEYLFRAKNGFPNPELTEYINYDDQGILTLFEESRTSRDVMIFAFIIVYGLNILDAHVEAHFVNFDISKDLSLQFKPKIWDYKTPMLSLTFSFR